jgi:hypothetical protein
MDTLEIAAELDQLDKAFTHPGLCGDAAQRLRLLVDALEKLTSAVNEEGSMSIDDAMKLAVSRL